MRGKPRIIRNKRLAKANNASPKGAFRLSAAERKKYNRMTDKEDKMNLRIALAGNPNSGKTTLFNALTGSNQFVGNWPGVTVEKKEGKLKKHSDVTITDLPGIYSLSPYTMEEVVARNYLIEERPDAILNIIDGTNLERNLYLTTQLTELGIPVVIAINMMDIVRKNGDKINIGELSQALGCKICLLYTSRCVLETGTGGRQLLRRSAPASHHCPCSGAEAPHPDSGRQRVRTGLCYRRGSSYGHPQNG